MKTKPNNCNHIGDKTNFHPQYCKKCGKEFMYDILTKPNNSDWQERFDNEFIYQYGSAFCCGGDYCEGTEEHTKKVSDDLKAFISSELQRAFSDGEENQAREDQKDILRLINEAIKQERDKTLKEVERIIENANWICGTYFIINGERKKFIVKDELLSKIKELKKL